MAGERILFVEDEEQIRKLVGTYLQRAGYQVGFAVDGWQGLQAIGAQLPDLVLTDVNMPNMTGLELTRRLRAHHKTARLPIIMLSALKETQDMLAGYAEGADDYLPKPIELAVLAAKIDTVLKRRAQAGLPQAPEVGKVIAFMHGKGGAGTTSLAVNCALALAVPPVRVSLLDLNLEFAADAIHLNLRPARTLAELASIGPGVDDSVLEAFAIAHSSQLRLVVGANVPEHAELVSIPAIQQTLDWLRRTSDLVVVDCPANFSERTLTALDASSAVCLVSDATVPSLKATLDCVEVLDKLRYPAGRRLLVLNRRAPLGMAQEQVNSFFGRPPDLVVNYSELFDRAANSGRPVLAADPQGSAAAELRALAAGLVKVADPGP